MDIGIEIIKDWVDEFQYWWEAICFLVAVIIFFVGRTKHYFSKFLRWFKVRWPYYIIRKQKEEIDRLRGGEFGQEEAMILQLLWIRGTEENIKLQDVMDIICCESQKAQYILDRLHHGGLIVNHLYYTGIEYSMTKDGRNYIVNNQLEVSSDIFAEQIAGYHDARRILEQYSYS